jgi:hypothetical protein
VGLHTGRDERVGHLKQDRARPTEQDNPLSVEAVGDRRQR